MKPKNLLHRCVCLLNAALLSLASTGTGFGADTYSGDTLTSPAVLVGNVTYHNMALTIAGILSGPSGTSGNSGEDSYSPASNEITVPSVTVNATTYHNVVATAGGLVSIGSVTGADVYSAPNLSIASVQVGTAIYNNVVVSVEHVVGVTGGMPKSVRDKYNTSTNELNIPAVQVGAVIYTNVVVTVALVLSVSGVDVPNVVGETQAAAATALGATRLVVGTVTTTNSSTVAAGKIISQKPVAGATAAPGSAVNLTVSLGPLPDALTYHYDVSRSGLNSLETALTPAKVNLTTFGKVAEFAIDGQVHGAVLYVNQLSVPGAGTKNVLYFGTENDSVYAVDAASVIGTSATVLWKTSVLGAGETTVPLASVGCGDVDPMGVTSTPVIDRSRNAIYVLSFSMDNNGHFFHRLHALNLTTGAELFGGPVTISANYAVTTGTLAGHIVSFQAQFQFDRAALLESGKTIYTAWGGQYGECGTFNGWLIGYDAGTLAQTTAIDLNPNSNLGGIWLGGGGPSADSAGNIYLATGATTDQSGPGTNGDYAQSLVRLSGTGNLALLDFFGLSNAVSLNNQDLSLASSNSLLFPNVVDSVGRTRHLASAAGKDGNLYIVDRDNMGGWNANANNVYQQINLGAAAIYSSPAYFNHSFYISPVDGPLQSFGMSQAHLSTAPTSATTISFFSRGTVPSVSSNGTTGGIVWALDGPNGILYAYDAANLATELYDSNQAALNRDHFARVAGHFITPVVANGRVYFGTGSTIAVFGLLAP